MVARSLGGDVENETDQGLLDSLRSMRVKDLKVELTSLNVSTQNALEKEELVQRLFKARTTSGQPRKSKKKKKRRSYDAGADVDDGDTMRQSASTNGEDAGAFYSPTQGYVEATTNGAGAGGWTVRVPFEYHEVGSSGPVASLNDGDLLVRHQNSGRYAAIKVQLTKGQSSSVTLTLLVDTACSGMVLSPDAASRANRECPGILDVSSGGATMTSAGGAQETAVARWDSSDTRLSVGGVEVPHANAAGCQDIGALPPELDGLLGLPFLDRFGCVDFDFANDELRLKDSDDSPMIPESIDGVVARGLLTSTKLRLFTADVTLDGRGPVKMIVDTGAASSFLNWAGVADMKLSSSSPQIEPIREKFGAIGADNMALELTHRFKLKRRWNVVAENNAVGDFCPGVALGGSGDGDDGINVDICDLPVLDALKDDGVGGILGADLFMICDVVRFEGLNRSSPTMTLMRQQ